MSSKAKVRSFAALLVLAAAFLLAALLGWGIPVEKARAETTHTVDSAQSLAQAMAAAQEGDTVQLTATIKFDLTDADLVSSIWPGRGPNKHLILDATDDTLPAQSQTLDLNGNTLEVITGSQESCFSLVGGVTLTITDSKGGGKIVGASNGNFFNGTAESGLVLEDVAIEFGDYADDIVADKPAISTAGSLSLNKVTYNAGTSGVDGPALVDTESLADGTYVYTVGSNYFVGGEEILSQAGAVAAIEETNESYASLKDAFGAATDGKTVKLLGDVYLTETIVVEAGSETIFDLNGKNITVQKNGERSLYAIDNYGTLTIMDSLETGSITARGVENLGSGVMTVNSGKIISCDTNGGASIWNEATLYVNGGTFETVHVGSPNDEFGAGCLNNTGYALITGGTFDSVNRRTYAIISTTKMEITPAEGKEVNVFGAHGALSSDGGTLVVNGGNYSSSDYYGLYVSNDGFGADPIQAAVTVNGGTFDGANYSVWIGSDYNDPVNSTIVINDGVFKKPLNAQDVTREDAIVVFGGTFSEVLPAEYLADGIVQMESDGGFTVGKAEELDGAVAMIEETGRAILLCKRLSMLYPKTVKSP